MASKAFNLGFALYHSYFFSLSLSSIVQLVIFRVRYQPPEKKNYINNDVFNAQCPASDRYDIHGKLVSFMAPIDKGSMADSSRFVQRVQLNFY